MIDKLRLAVRNVYRNGRRTFISLVMISGGIAAMTVFEGLTHHLLLKMREVVINTQFSHVQVANAKAWNLVATAKPADRLLELEPAVMRQIASAPDVEYSSGRLSFFGMISNGDQSFSARGIGFDPSVEKHLRESLRIESGVALSRVPSPSCEMIIGVILADQFGFKAGQSVTMMSYTFDGAMNAYDCEIKGVFRNGFPETDNVFYVHLATAQAFLATDRVDRLIVQLRETDRTDSVLSWLTTVLPSDAPARGWLQLSAFFRQTVEYLTMQTSVVRWIILLLALLATLNTISLSISERAGEIGTIRALGDSRWSITGQFLLEGLILALIGGVLGSLLGVGIGEVLGALNIAFPIPGSTVPMPMKVDFLPASYRDSILFMCAVTLLATLLPALRASRMEIVEALKRNI